MVANKKIAPKTEKKKSSGTEKRPAAKPRAAANATIQVDRRGKTDRRQGDRRIKNEPVGVERRVLQRRVKVNRRRQIDPTTCERDYTSEEIEFMNAMDHYKRTSGRMFPTCSEVLEVIRSLGYEKRPEPQPQAQPPVMPSVDLSAAVPTPTVVS